MTWTQIDDGLNFSPQTMPGMVSNAALGLWVRLCVHTAYQLRFPAFDGAFDMTVVRSLKGNARQVTELEAAGMLEPALAAGRWMVVEADTLMKFGGTSGSELKEKRAKAGHAGGVASGESRRSKREANASKQNEASASSKPRSKTEANHEAKDEANGEAKPKQTSEAKRSNCFEANEATGPNLTIPSLTSPVAPSAPNAEPSPAVPGHAGTESGRATPASSLAEAEARVQADPFAFAWEQYPSHTGNREQASRLWQAITGDDPTVPHVEASQLLGAVIRYAQAVRQDGNRFTPSMRKWLENRQYVKWLASEPIRTEWGGITRQWLSQHAISLVPAGAWTDSVEQTFWAHVKTGENPETVAQRLVNEINERSQAS